MIRMLAMLTHRNLRRGASLRRSRRIGSLYPVVMGVTALIACLAVAGLETSRVAGRVNQQMRDQVEARRIAQAGLEYWQRQYNAQMLSDPTSTLNVKVDSRSGFTVSATMSPLGVSPNGAAQVTSVGTFGTAIQRLTARYEARPTLYEGFRSALYSNDASITYSSSTVTANHWSIARLNTSSSSSSIGMDAMTGGSFSGTLSNFKQRRISGIPWNMQTASFDTANTSYPGAAYTSDLGAVTIQPPRGGDQLLSNSNFAYGINPWYSNSKAILSHDTTQGYNSVFSGRMTNRVTGNDSPLFDITNLLVKGANYRFEAFIRPNNASRFQIALTCYFGDLNSPSINYSNPVSMNANQWTNLNWNISYTGSTRPLIKAELGFYSTTNTSFNFDSVTLLNNSRNSGIAYIQNTVLSNTFNPFSADSSSCSSKGIYIVDCRGCTARIENARIRSTLVFTNCDAVELGGGIVWEVPNRNYPAFVADAKVLDNTTLSLGGLNVLSELDCAFNINPSHTPFAGISDNDLFDTYPCAIQGMIFSTDSVSLGNSDSTRGRISTLTGPVLAKSAISFQRTTKDINFDSNMILNPPPGFYPAFTPMRLIPSSIDEVSGTVINDQQPVPLIP